MDRPKDNSSVFFEILSNDFKKIISKPLNKEERESVGQAMINHIYDLDGPKEGKVKHSEKALFLANIIFRPFSEILDTLEMIKNIPIYISSFPFEDHGVSNTQYIQYHVGNYIVEAINVRNRLIRYVGKIKNAYKNSSNADKIAKSLKQLIKYVEKCFKNLKTARDSHVHECRYIDKDIDRLFSLELYKNNDFLTDKLGVDNQYKQSIKNLREFWGKQIEDELKQIHKVTDSYFKLLIILITHEGKLIYPSNLK